MVGIGLPTPLAPDGRRRVLTLTLSPTLDLATSADHVVPGPKLRCDAPRIDPGGGGVNVSRAIRILGGESLAIIVAAGHAGAMVEDLLRGEGIQPLVLPAPGPTRESLSVTDRSSGAQFRFVMPGPPWAGSDVEVVLTTASLVAQPGDLLVLSGSQPPGVPVDFPHRLAMRLAARGADLVLDTSGAALRHIVETPGAPPIATLRMDETEAAELAGGRLRHRHETADFAAALVARGVARTVIIARGADGSVLAAEGLRLHGLPPRVQVVSKVGAGDSFTGAYVLALSRGAGPATALQSGVAAAASAVSTEATRLCRPEDVARLTPLCPVTAM